MKKKIRLISWVVSNCEKAPSMRMEYVQSLQKYIGIDIYGKIKKILTNFLTNFFDQFFWRIFWRIFWQNLSTNFFWQIFFEDFFWPLIFQLLQALGSEYLRSCFNEWNKQYFFQTHFLALPLMEFQHFTCYWILYPQTWNSTTGIVTLWVIEISYLSGVRGKSLF